MPCDDIVAVSGRLRTEAGRAVRGAALRIVAEESETLLAETASGEDGFFRAEIDVAGVPAPDRAEGTLSVRALDGQGRTLGRRSHVTWAPGEEVRVELELDPGELDGFVPVADPLDRYSGPLHDEEALEVLRDAIALMYEPGTPAHNRFMNGALCPLPPLFGHDNLLDAATGVIDGDPYARLELTQILEPYAEREVGFETRLDQVVLEAAARGQQEGAPPRGGWPSGPAW